MAVKETFCRNWDLAGAFLCLRYVSNSAVTDTQRIITSLLSPNTGKKSIPGGEDAKRIYNQRYVACNISMLSCCNYFTYESGCVTIKHSGIAFAGVITCGGCFVCCFKS